MDGLVRSLPDVHFIVKDVLQITDVYELKISLTYFGVMALNLPEVSKIKLIQV